MPKSVWVKYTANYYEVGNTRISWSADELNYWRKYWGHKYIAPAMVDVEGRGRAREPLDVGQKPEVPKRNEKEKMAESAAPAVRRQDTPSAPPLQKTRKYENYVDNVG